jgi:hypothetical protein
MREKIFGLKKEPINKMLQKMESDFLYEKIEIEFELKNLIEQNNKFRSQLKESTSRRFIALEDEALWMLGKERIGNITKFLEEQKKAEIVELRKKSSERNRLIHQEIKEIDQEIQSTEQLFSKMFQQLANMVQQVPNEGPKAIDKQFSSINYTLDPVNDPTEKETVFQDEPGQRDQPDVNEEVTKHEGEAIDEGEQSFLDQIDSIKSQYIVGNVAGEDLYDPQGSLIISRSQIITRQVVNKAHREGKLAELIVNMKITGLGED